MHPCWVHLQAQTAFLLHLAHSEAGADVVFLDTDVLVVDDLGSAFCQEFDYAVTLSDAADMPINIGMQVGGRRGLAVVPAVPPSSVLPRQGTRRRSHR